MGFREGLGCKIGSREGLGLWGLNEGFRLGVRVRVFNLCVKLCDSSHEIPRCLSSGLGFRCLRLEVVEVVV